MPVFATTRPADPQSSGFRAFADYIERQAVPNGWAKVFKSWKGEPGDDDEPSIGQLNWVRLTPLAMPSEPMASRGPTARRTYQCPLRVEFDLAVNGYLVDELPNFWGRLESVIFPTPDSVAGRDPFWATLASHGIRDIYLIQRAAPENRAFLSEGMIRGIGAVVLVFILQV